MSNFLLGTVKELTTMVTGKNKPSSETETIFQKLEYIISLTNWMYNEKLLENSKLFRLVLLSVKESSSEYEVTVLLFILFPYLKDICMDNARRSNLISIVFTKLHKVTITK